MEQIGKSKYIKKVLVMGANGYIGSNLVSYLCSMPEKYEVIASSRNNNNIDVRAKFVRYDVSDTLSSASDFLELFGEVDICVYMTWQDGFNHNSDSHMKDLNNHWCFIKNAIDAGVNHLCVAGSFREYGNNVGVAYEDQNIIPDNFYVLAKDTLHKAINIYLKDKKEVCFQWIRPFSVWGNDEINNSVFSKMLVWDKEGRESFPCTEGIERYDYVHIDDTVKQIEAIINQTDIGGVINVCSGVSKSLREMVEEFISIHHLSIRPHYGEFKRRPYDSDEIYGDRAKINRILEEYE